MRPSTEPGWIGRSPERRPAQLENKLLTRGHFIGQIVDDLSDIASQARQRARLGFTDLHVYIENFVMEVLNRAYGLACAISTRSR